MVTESELEYGNITVMIHTQMTYCYPSRHSFFKDITYADNYAIIICVEEIHKCTRSSSSLLPTPKQTVLLFICHSLRLSRYLSFYLSNILFHPYPSFILCVLCCVENSKRLIRLIVTYGIHYMSCEACMYWVLDALCIRRRYRLTRRCLSNQAYNGANYLS